MERVADDVEVGHVGIADLDAFLVDALVEEVFDLEASLGGGGADRRWRRLLAGALCSAATGATAGVATGRDTSRLVAAGLNAASSSTCAMCRATDCGVTRYLSPSVDGTHEIFIVPTLDDPVRIADVLAHELVHAAVGTNEGHGRPFRKVALAIGLQGKMKATTAGPLFLERVEPILAAVGPLPHARLDWSGGPPKQSTRLLKAYCEHCGYTARITSKWLNVAGPPLCPIDGVPMIDERARNFARLRAEMIAAHPDKGGSHEAFIAARAAYERARRMIR